MRKKLTISIVVIIALIFIILFYNKKEKVTNDIITKKDDNKVAIVSRLFLQKYTSEVDNKLSIDSKTTFAVIKKVGNSFVCDRIINRRMMFFTGCFTEFPGINSFDKRNNYISKDLEIISSIVGLSKEKNNRNINVTSTFAVNDVIYKINFTEKIEYNHPFYYVFYAPKEWDHEELKLCLKEKN